MSAWPQSTAHRIAPVEEGVNNVFNAACANVIKNRVVWWIYRTVRSVIKVSVFLGQQKKNLKELCFYSIDVHDWVTLRCEHVIFFFYSLVGSR